MKKFYVLLVTMILLFTASTIAFAAVELGGNLRVWYKSNLEPTTGVDSVGGFYFDRLALKVGASVSENNGFRSELRFVYKSNLTTMAYDQLYYYQKNLIADGDELNVGYIFLPYYNDKYISLVESLGKNKGSAKNSNGLRYNLKADGFEGSLAVTNWKNDTATLGSADGTGLDEALRLSLKVMDGLNIGVGYINDASVSGGTTTTTTGRLVADVLFAMDPFTVFFEYVNVSPSSGSAQSGMYLEPSFKLSDGITVYLAGTLASKESGLQDSEYYAGGVKFMVAPKTALQAEYLSYPDKDYRNSFGVRLRVDF
jgi:hypothetical protein